MAHRTFRTLQELFDSLTVSPPEIVAIDPTTPVEFRHAIPLGDAEHDVSPKCSCHPQLGRLPGNGGLWWVHVRRP